MVPAVSLALSERVSVPVTPTQSATGAVPDTLTACATRTTSDASGARAGVHVDGEDQSPACTLVSVGVAQKSGTPCGSCAAAAAGNKTARSKIHGATPAAVPTSFLRNCRCVRAGCGVDRGGELGVDVNS